MVHGGRAGVPVGSGGACVRGTVAAILARRQAVQENDRGIHDGNESVGGEKARERGLGESGRVGREWMLGACAIR